MKQNQLLFLFLLFHGFSFAQNYFQQQVDYKIDVHLDIEKNTLEGTEIVTYKNNAPTTLSKIYFHLWANAYQDKDSDFGKQKLRNAEKDFYFAKKEELGGYSELSFSSENSENQWEYDKSKHDIAIVQLKNPLKTGASVELIVHFTIKIPIPFSRFNRIDQSYNITQWYPKPAVYDKNGWHPFPYLDYGEFYSEFGDFDVTISLPDDYIVAATGTLTTQHEIDRLNHLVIQTDSLISDNIPIQRMVDSNKMKTLHYTAKNVHDFAWFANRNFIVGKKEFQLSDGSKKTAWAYFLEDELDAWKEATDIVVQAVKTQSQWIGNYPYPQATAVLGETPVGGGMEYPMVTNIAPNTKGKSLDQVIRHEVGHNWFYGILGTNERQFAWMDEGINTYYDGRYARKFYPKKQKKQKKRFLDLQGDSSEDQFLFEINSNPKQEANSSSDAGKMHTLQYVLAAYNKPGMAFRYLEQYLGTAKFDKAMKTYFKKWQFKHPYPEDLQKIMEAETGKDLDWLFHGFLESTDRMDYAISSVKSEDGLLEIKVINLGNINAPISLDIIKDGEIIKKIWQNGFEDVEIITVNVDNYDKIVLDSKLESLDVNRRNNVYFRKTHFFKPITFKPIFSLGNTQENRILYFPIMGWNKYDKSMVGISFYNFPYPAKKIDYWISPLYSFTSKSLNGFARLRYNVYPDHAFSKISFGINARRFSESIFEDAPIKYRKINPFIQIDIKKDPISYVQHSIIGNFYSITKRKNGEKLNPFPDYRVMTLDYQINNSHPIYPTFANLEFENNTAGGSNNKLSLEIKQKWYYSKTSNISLRLFLGNSFTKQLPVNALSGFSLYGNSFLDYKYEDISRFRSAINNTIAEREGGFKNKNVSLFQNLATAESIIATNLVFSLPRKFSFIKPYLDFAILGGVLGTPKSYWETGVSLGIKDYLSVNFPITGSNTVNGKYKKQISLTINLKKIDPWKINFNQWMLKMIN